MTTLSELLAKAIELEQAEEAKALALAEPAAPAAADSGLAEQVANLTGLVEALMASSAPGEDPAADLEASAALEEPGDDELAADGLAGFDEPFGDDPEPEGAGEGVGADFVDDPSVEVDPDEAVMLEPGPDPVEDVPKAFDFDALDALLDDVDPEADPETKTLGEEPAQVQLTELELLMHRRAAIEA